MISLTECIGTSDSSCIRPLGPFGHNIKSGFRTLGPLEHHIKGQTSGLSTFNPPPMTTFRIIDFPVLGPRSYRLPSSTTRLSLSLSLKSEGDGETR